MSTNPRKCYCTPDDLFDWLNDWLGPFELDAAADEHNSRCPFHICEEEDALSRRWVVTLKTIFVNPPFHNIIKWARKAHEEAQRDPLAVVVMICPNSNAEWYQFAKKYAHEIIHLYPRPEFVPPPGVTVSGGGNRGDINVVIWRKNPPVPDECLPGAREWVAIWPRTIRPGAAKQQDAAAAAVSN